MSSVIEVKQLVKRYRDCEALSGVSLEVPAGVVFALLGENGAGKTTMIRCLTGFETPTSGTARVLEMDCQQHAQEVRRRVGYVSDRPALYDWMRADEIGWFTSAFYGEGFLQRYHELLARYEVPLGRKIKQMSRGQRAKIALALATAHDPDLLILDEPTSGLDPVVRRQFLESMVDRAAVGKTVFLSSHQISEVERVADWVGIVHEGHLRVLEPLSRLKEAVRDLRFTLSDSEVAVPEPRATVLDQQRQGRQVRMMVLGMSDEELQSMRGATGVVGMTSLQPTLEEIFVACTHGLAPLREGTSTVAASVTSEPMVRLR